jgi:1,3-beta-glucan synthase
LKQTKLRRRRVVRYAILYFFLLVVFIALLVGPVVAGKFMKLDIAIPMDLLQPTGLNNNDTTSSVTGRCRGGMQCPGPGGDDAVATESSSSDKLRRFVAF